ncbi:MAG: hypothetical protein ABR922_24615 [Streptosporangiaceae bacterium]
MTAEPGWAAAHDRPRPAPAPLTAAPGVRCGLTRKQVPLVLL